MASISYSGFGKAPVVLLCDADRAELAQAIASKQADGITGKQLAEMAGVNRTYFYSLVSGYQVDLIRFAKMQKVLGTNLLNPQQVEEYLSSLRSLLID